MRIVDVHCHLESEALRDRLEDILGVARDAGIVKLVTASVVPEDWALSRAIAERFEAVAFAWGIHPWYAAPEHIDRVAELAAAKATGAAAIGEIGLDKKISSPAFDLQREVFIRQLDIARQTDLPIVVHCRGAFDELLGMVKKLGLPARGGVLHAFSGSPEIAEACVRAGFYLSFGRSLTYRNSPKRERTVKMVYPDRFLLETDSPDLPPVEAPPGPNVPANILYNLRAAAEILGLPEETIAEQTTQNAKRLFGWDFL